jgi:hypothetical protein
VLCCFFSFSAQDWALGLSTRPYRLLRLRITLKRKAGKHISHLACFPCVNDHFTLIFCLLLAALK